jgi:hypothetical protein
MAQDGKRLEALVAFVERSLIPQGFKVTTNDRVLNDEGLQIAEFDVLVEGTIGTGNFQWLIECRDRPSSGAAPGSWIEQLVGRRTRFNLSKVTAVSTTGFASGVHEFARAQAIELREVKSLAPEHFADWLRMEYITNIVRHTSLQGSYFQLLPDTSASLREALSNLFPTFDGQSPILRSSSTGELVSLARAFSAIAEANQQIFAGLEVNGEPRQVRFFASYPEDDRFLIDTSAGEIILQGIEFVGELRIKESKLPIIHTAEYRDARTGEPIDQVVTYAPQSIMGEKFCVELHKLSHTGETHVTLRKLASDA